MENLQVQSMNLDEKNGNLKSCERVGLGKWGKQLQSQQNFWKNHPTSRLFPPNPILVRRRSENKVQQFVEVLETSTERDGNPSIKTQKSTCFHERNFTRFTKQILPALKPATRSPGLTGTLSSDDGLFIQKSNPYHPGYIYPHLVDFYRKCR